MTRHPTRLDRRAVDLTLRHVWTTAHGSSRVRKNVLLRLSHGGLEGLGEAASSARFQEDAPGSLAALDRLAPHLDRLDPEALDTSLDRVAALLPGRRAAQAAVDIALHDLAGRLLGRPLFALVGSDPAAMPPTAFSIGIGDVEATRAQARGAAGFRVLKVKLGGPDDRAAVEAIRSVTDVPLYVDANEGWRDPATAIAMIRWLRDLGVVLVEQPLPAADVEGARAVRARSALPILADEAVRTVEDVAAAAAAYDGINIKLQKAGGIRMARRMIEAARARGLRVMIGCMIETSIGITAAAHLAPLCDFVDLDGNLLIADDPFRGAVVRDGRLELPGRPGLGVEGPW